MILPLDNDFTAVRSDCDDNAGDIQRVFNTVKAISPIHNRRLRSFGFADKASSIGLQIGDFLAVTSRKYVGKYSHNTGYPEQPRYSFDFAGSDLFD